MNPCIVLVETSQIVRRAIEITLAQLGHPVISVDDANAALEMIEHRPTLMVIAATQLPGIDGYSLAHRLGEDPSTGHLPVLLLLSQHESMTGPAESARSSFSRMRKPFLSQALVETVCTALGLSIPNEELYRPYMVDLPLANPTPLEQEPPALRPDEGTDDSIELPLNALDSSHQHQVPEQEELKSDLQSEEEKLESEPESVHLASNEHVSDPVEQDVGDLHEQVSRGESLEDSVSDSMDQDDPTESVADLHPSVEELVIDAPREVPAVTGRHIPERPASVLFDEEDEPATTDDISPPDVTAAALMPSPEETKQSIPLVDPIVVETSSDVLEQTQSRTEDLLESVTSTAVDHLANGQSAVVSAMSREVIEAVAWEVIPPLAEAILREEIARILKDERGSGKL